MNSLSVKSNGGCFSASSDVREEMLIADVANPFNEEGECVVT